MAMSAESKTEDPQGYSAEAFSFIREKWIRDQMKTRVKEFTEEKKLHLYLGTWNVNAKTPKHEPEDLMKWVHHKDAPEPDVVGIGFQEIVDLNAVNLVSDHQASIPWEQRIEESLPGTYRKVTSVHLVGLSLCVWVKAEHFDKLHDISDNTVGVGIMGVGGNKGAVGIRFRLYDSTVVIVNSHLAAHKGNVQGRNMDYANIAQRLAFQSGGHTDKLFDHDHIFWIGDLNYRLNLADYTLVLQRVEAQDWSYLLQHDQLILEKRKKTAFQDWIEGPIDFAPTYKYTPGTDEFDQVKMRFPAWCDRIQWRNGDIRQIFYRRVNLRCSDHKPVCALFETQMKILVEEKRKQVYQSIVRQLDDWENKAIPKVSLSKNTVHFNKVAFDAPLVQTLRIKNTGVGAVKFRFVPKLEEQHFARPWLTVDPPTGYMPPDQEMDLRLTVHVHRDVAPLLNAEKEKLQDILILRLENGRDYFITVSGDYLKSCFGSTIEHLVKTPGPIRASSVQGAEAARALSIPKELWRMVDYLYPDGMDEEGLFITAGDATQIEQIRECLDTGQPFGQFDMLSMAETLVRFLETLAEPIFPSSLCSTMPSDASLTAWCMQSLVKLSPAKYNTFIYVTSFLREVLKRAHVNKLSVDQLIVTFSSCLMHWNHYETGAAPRASKEWLILQHFLTSTEFE